ncbi:putative late blight resistance protein homolog R1A-10 [Andrographis paniculata]|uniref:putative late blight resistance protein homolog R1A-10 n=1 Tax=Andrographis paniculata TaxID=175694 RepID=UPI0021E71384|nr:putative late blight resistance protein homolog R1A-10 [Andrographis paniculata]
MAAAYAAVLSFLHTVRRIKNSSSQLTFYRWQIDRLGEMGCLFQEFLKTHFHGDSQQLWDLERKIVDAAHNAEDAIDNCIVAEFFKGSRSDLLSQIKLLVRVVENMKSIIQLCVGLKDQVLLPSRSLASSSSHPAHHHLHQYSMTGSWKKPVVGLEIEQNYILENLMARLSSLQVIVITGIVGIGKTTLAQSTYENDLVLSHFDVRIWVTMCKECSLRDVLEQMCACLIAQEHIDASVTDNQLKEFLFQGLFGRTYLIILDNMMSLEIWDSIRFCLPDNNNMSRLIIVITKPSRMTASFHVSVLEKGFLDEVTSWKMLCRTTFGIEGCPNGFENIGQDIARKCKGVPLFISVIGGLLKNLPLIKDKWEIVTRDLKPTLTLKDCESYANILSLSYKYLPEHLKPCFLYLGNFPENHEICASQLIKLWIAEGFVQQCRDNKSLEEIGEDYLKDLVDRNLVLVLWKGLTGKIKACCLHECIRDLCLTIAQQESFYVVSRNHYIAFNEEDLSQEFDDALNPPRRRTLICRGEGMPEISDKSLLRVVDDVDINSFEDIFRHVNLKYIRCCSTSVRAVPSAIWNLWSLQTIICHNTRLVSAPIEIWSMKHLRHVEFSEIYVPNPNPNPNPPSTIELQEDNAMEHLQTFMNIVNFKCTKEVLRKMKHIKKLKIKLYKENADYCLENICGLKGLESLTIYFLTRSDMNSVLLRQFSFPISLKKLSLDNIKLFPDDVGLLSSLFNLEDLRINGCILGGCSNRLGWPFRSLKYLRIYGFTEIDFRDIDKCCFPVLEILDLGTVVDVTIFLGDIPSLRVLQLHSCRGRTALSALQMLVERERRGIDEDLQVRVSMLDREEMLEFRRMVETSKLSVSPNFTVEIGPV